VILRALAKDPAERFESAEAFRRALLDARDSGAGGVSASGIDELTAVLVNSDVRETVRLVRALKKACPGATVLSVSDGRMGLEFVREIRPDVIVLDTQCHGLNALELLATLQGEESLAEATRVLVLSEKSDPLETRLFADLGVSEVLRKPISSEGLVRALLRPRGAAPR
jgi:CheY-like chemotaxis protein